VTTTGMTPILRLSVMLPQPRAAVRRLDFCARNGDMRGPDALAGAGWHAAYNPENRDPMSDDKKPEAETSPDAPRVAPDAAAELDSAGQGEFSAGQLKEIIAALQEELDAKTKSVSEKHDQYLRAVAETENVRRRMEREKDETAKYAISKFAKDILSVGDNFQRAISAVPKDAIETDPALKTLLDGVILAERDFRGALERHGVKIIDPAGLPFNPHHHQAVMEQENPDVPNGTVLQVFQSGYLIDDRCLRPAMVVVSRGGAKAAKASDTAPPEAGLTEPLGQTGEPANDQD
jgi:molecular chaperone GrpE